MLMLGAVPDTKDANVSPHSQEPTGEDKHAQGGHHAVQRLGAVCGLSAMGAEMRTWLLMLRRVREYFAEGV